VDGDRSSGKERINIRFDVARCGNIHGLHDSTNISRLQHYTMALYKELEGETGQSCGIFQPGSLYLAQTEAREHQLSFPGGEGPRYEMNFLPGHPG
jgi:dimethylglycine dehydrogenase